MSDTIWDNNILYGILYTIGIFGSLLIVTYHINKPIYKNGLGTLILTKAICDLIQAIAYGFELFLDEKVGAELGNVGDSMNELSLNLSLLLSIFSYLLVSNRTVLDRYWKFGILTCIAFALIRVIVDVFVRQSQVQVKRIVAISWLVFILISVLVTMASCILVIVTLRKHNTIQKTKFSNTRDYIHHQYKKEKARLLMFRLIVAVMSVNLLYWIPQVMLTIVSVQSQSLHWSRLQVFLNYFNAMKGMILFIAICTAIKWSFQSVSLPVHNDTVHDTLHDTVHDTVEKNSSIQMPSIAYSDTVPMNSINRSMMFNRPMFSRPALQDSGLNII